MHFYFVFDTGVTVGRSCADWGEARRVAQKYAAVEDAPGVVIAWKAGGEAERWETRNGQWTQIDERDWAYDAAAEK